jgi:hypothetical protein
MRSRFPVTFRRTGIRSGRRSALLRSSPLRTVRATHRGTRLKQILKAFR